MYSAKYEIECFHHRKVFVQQSNVWKDFNKQIHDGLKNRGGSYFKARSPTVHKMLIKDRSEHCLEVLEPIEQISLYFFFLSSSNVMDRYMDRVAVMKKVNPL